MIVKKTPDPIVVIDLTGSQGNIFFLINYAKSFCRLLGINFSVVKQEMLSSDYDNAVKVFDSYFGDFVLLYR